MEDVISLAMGGGATTQPASRHNTPAFRPWDGTYLCTKPGGQLGNIHHQRLPPAGR